MPKKFYVVWVGREPGIFTDWSSAKRSIDKYPGARFKSFGTAEEAAQAFSTGKVQGASRANSAPKVANHKNGQSKVDYDIQIYCDGACEPNPGESGSGVAIYTASQLTDLWYGLYNVQGTNNTAELNALQQALRVAEQYVTQKKKIEILCDSMYSINCAKTWATTWKRNGWKKANGEIKNLELIKENFSIYEKIKGEVQLSYVKAHAGIEGNELADRMSMLAVKNKEAAFVKFSEPLDIKQLLMMRPG